MRFHADFHIHSKYSRATSKDCDLEHLTFWGRKKGLTVLGTGDFTHPAWRAELRDKLVPAEAGLFRLRPELEQDVERLLPSVCHGPTRFMLSVEISTIYKKGERTRKVHHLVIAPDFDTVERVVQRLERIGNLRADGRPILGLDSRHLLEIVLESGPDAYLIPAHIWTPWFAVLGSKSGFDAVEECYGDLSPHIFAVETGLSSDPPMNWRVSSLDRYRLVSNSDAHSPQKLGREACAFDTDLDYFALRRALETGQGYSGTVEFFPEEGKYHLDGHRKCGVCLSPQETRQHGGRCPVCQKPVTEGVLNRVDVLADRDEAAVPPPTAGDVRNLVPLPEILAELLGTASGTKTVSRAYEQLIDQLGPELFILEDAPLEEVRHAGPALLGEAITRLRQGQVLRQAGYDGEYGVIRLFETAELRRHTSGEVLFELPRAAEPATPPGKSPLAPPGQKAEHVAETETDYQADTRRQHTTVPPLDQDVLAGLDAEQRAAAEHAGGPLLIIAGPGSGKTRTLTHRIAYLVTERGVPAAQCLAITFTRRAATEVRQRLQRLLPQDWQDVAVHTFHSLGLTILQEHGRVVGLHRGFRVADEPERLDLLRTALGTSQRETRRVLEAISRAKRTCQPVEDVTLRTALETYEQALTLANLVDFDDLVRLAVQTLEADADVAAQYQQRFAWLFIDEYQDVDEQQYRLVERLVPPGGNLCAIGDPDQAIYSFRGADVRFFYRFVEDFPQARTVRLSHNYRSSSTIVAASSQVITAGDTAERSMPAVLDGQRITIHAAPTEQAEAEFVVHTIEQLLGGHSFFSMDSGRVADETGMALSFADVAVLYRTEAQAATLSEALARSGMPFQSRSHSPLSLHPGVQALRSWLQEATPPGTVRQHIQSAAAHTVETGAVDASTVQTAIELLLPLAEAVGEDRERFLAELALLTSVDTWDPRADRVSLLTLHAAKGLEFAVVFLVGCEDGLLPLRWGESSQEALDEERRLFYVGMTRAKERLLLCRARRRRWRGTVLEMEPSPFLRAIEQQLLEQRESAVHKRRQPETTEQLPLFG
jgi:DNA helicase-2/ATP-dependent DNA helicase PcrA